jgi:hypothetical protein
MPKKMMKKELMRKPKFRKMEPIEPLPSKDDYMDEIESGLMDEELPAMKNDVLDREDVYPDGSDIEEMGEILTPLPKMNMDLKPLPYEEYVGPGSSRRKRYEEQMQTEKDAAPMRTLRAAKEGFVEGAKEGVSNIKKAATAVAEGTGIAPAYRAARSAVKSVGRLASETNRAKNSQVDPAVKELSDMMGAGVITDADLNRFREMMKVKKGAK